MKKFFVFLTIVMLIGCSSLAFAGKSASVIMANSVSTPIYGTLVINWENLASENDYFGLLGFANRFATNSPYWAIPIQVNNSNPF